MDGPAIPADEDSDPFGVLEILRRRTDLVDRLGALRRRTGPQSSSARGEAEPPRASSSAVVASLPFLESVYCLTRVTPAAHRVRVAYSLNGEQLAAVCSWLPGRSAASVNSCLGRGPCCAVHDVDLPTSVSAGIPADEREAAVSAAIEAVRRRSPHCIIAAASYVGLYGEATITEALSRTPPGSSAQGELRRSLEAERCGHFAGVPTGSAGVSSGRSAAQRELDLLDLDCMLSILGPGPAGGAGGDKQEGAPGGDGGDALVSLASVTLFFDCHGRELKFSGPAAASEELVRGDDVNALEGLSRTLTTATASLASVGLRHDSQWLPFRRDSPGSLLLVALSNAGALAPAVAAGIRAEASRLVEVATTTRARALAGTGALDGTVAAGSVALVASQPPQPWTAPGWQLVTDGRPAPALARDSPVPGSAAAAAAAADSRELRELRWVKVAWRPRRARRGGGGGVPGATAGVASEGGVDVIAVDVAALGAAVDSGAPFVDFSAACAALRLVFVLRCHVSPRVSPPAVSAELLIFEDGQRPRLAADAVSRPVSASEEGGSSAPPLASVRSDARFSLARVTCASEGPLGDAADTPRRPQWYCTAPSILAARPAHPTAVVQGVSLRGGGGGDEPPLPPVDVVVEATQAEHY